MNKTVFRIIRVILIIACLAIICFEGYKIYDEQQEYTVADTEYEEIEKKAVVWPAAEDAAELVDYPLITIDFDALEATNEDFVAWLYFPALEISYPVVKESYVDEYINTTFDGKTNKAGCLFEDVLSNSEFRGMHDIVFGHNMKNQSMFGSLKRLYKKGNEDLLKDNPYVYIYTREYIFRYRVFGYYITNVGSYAYTNVLTDNTYDELVQYVKANSMYETPADADFSARPSLLTLSTCSGASGSGKRFVVHTYKTDAWQRQ